MNNVILIGNLVADPISKDFNGKERVTFRLAVRKTQEESNFFNITTWEKQAAFVRQYAVKGTKVAISGSLECFVKRDEAGNFESEQYYVNAMNVEILTPKSQQTQQPQQAPQPPKQQPQYNNISDSQFTPNVADDEELPF